MRKIYFNLAENRKIDTRAFTWVAAALFLAAVVCNGVSAFNLAGVQRRNRAENSDVRQVNQKLQEVKTRTAQYQAKIADWKAKWGKKLDFANALIQRKRFSFVARLDFLEKNFGPGTRIREITLVNEAQGMIRMSVDAVAWSELLRLYKKLASLDLVIESENQAQEMYQAKLRFKIKEDEKI